MDPVREALTLVADDVSTAHLLPPSHLREQAEAGRRRRRVIGALAGVGIAATVVWLSAAGPWVSVSPDPAPIATPTPAPSASTVLWTTGCGFATSCPEGAGPFRFVLQPQRGGDQLAVDATLPGGWAVRAYGDDLLRMTPLPAQPGSTAPDPVGVAVLWPVAPHGGASSTDAEAFATTVAALPGSTSAAPQSVTVGGRRGWRVELGPSALTPRTSCLDPTTTAQGGPSSDPCRVLFDLLVRDVANPRTPIGVGRATTVQLTVLEGSDVVGAGGGGLAVVLLWGDPGADAYHAAGTLVDALRWSTYADPFCGGDGGPACPPTSGDAEVRGDPIATLTGIHEWRAYATVGLAPGWSVLSDDARGHVQLTAGQDVTSFLRFVWQPTPPSGGWSVTDAHAWATAMRHRPHLTSTAVRATTIDGRPAWTVDVGVRQDVPEAGVPCPGSSTAYAVVLECSGPGEHPSGTALDSNDQARVWFVQADPTHVLMVIVEGKKAHVGQPAILPTAVAATASMIDSLRISTSP